MMTVRPTDMALWQAHELAGCGAVHVPVAIAKRLKLKPGAILSRDVLGDVREALGLSRSFPKQLPMMFIAFGPKEN